MVTTIQSDSAGSERQFVLDSAASGDGVGGSNGAIVGQLRLTSGWVTYGGTGALSVLASGGGVRGSIAPNQSLDLQCNSGISFIDWSQSLVNNHTVRFLPPAVVGSTVPNGEDRCRRQGVPVRLERHAAHHGCERLLHVVTAAESWCSVNSTTGAKTDTRPLRAERRERRRDGPVTASRFESTGRPDRRAARACRHGRRHHRNRRRSARSRRVALRRA